MKRYAFSGLKSGIHEGGGPCQKEDGLFLSRRKIPVRSPLSEKMLSAAQTSIMRGYEAFGGLGRGDGVMSDIDMVTCYTGWESGCFR